MTTDVQAWGPSAATIAHRLFDVYVIIIIIPAVIHIIRWSSASPAAVIWQLNSLTSPTKKKKKMLTHSFCLGTDAFNNCSVQMS